MRRFGLGLILAASVVVLGTATPIRAAVLWTLTASPLTVQTGVQTTFGLRASLTLLGEIRCVRVGVPANFTIHGASVVGSNAGDSWVSAIAGNEVRIRTTSGGDRLRSIGHFVDFTITATAASSGSLAWTSNAYADENCTGAGSLLSVPPIVLVVGPAATPTPAPTAAPTPAPTPPPAATPRPSAVPSPTAAARSAPVVTPTATPRPTAAGVVEAPDRSAGARPSPTGGGSPRSPLPDPTPADVGGAVGPPPGAENAGTRSPRAPAGVGLLAEPPADSGAEPAPVPIELGALGLMGSIEIWIVPGLLLGVPGLLVVVFVILQGIGALAWVPAIRRLRGDDEGASPAAV